MATRFLPLLRPHPVPLALGIGISSIFAAQSFLSQPPRSLLIRCDALPMLRDQFETYQTDAKVPIVKRGRLNPGAVRQISTGSIAGLLGGLAVSVFSKPLALLLGLLILGVQGLESQGIHIIPYGRLQSLFKNTDIRSALQDNVAFKVSFGAAFALAGFAEF